MYFFPLLYWALKGRKLVSFEAKSNLNAFVLPYVKKRSIEEPVPMKNLSQRLYFWQRLHCTCTHRKILSTLGENSCRLRKCGRPKCASYGRSALKIVQSNTKKLNDCCDCPLNDEKRVSDASWWDIVSIRQINTLTSIVLFQRWCFSLGYLGLYQVKWQEESENQPMYWSGKSWPGYDIVVHDHEKS